MMHAPCITKKKKEEERSALIGETIARYLDPQQSETQALRVYNFTQ